jgi:hypothetical protein
MEVIKCRQHRIAVRKDNIWEEIKEILKKVDWEVVPQISKI